MRNGLSIALLFIAAGFAIYFTGLAIPHYGDDFQIILDSPSSKISYFFFHAHPSNWYRPLEASFHAATQALFGSSALPIHVVAVLSHSILAWLVWSFMLRLGFTKPQALLGAFFMLFSQANVHAVLSNDTLAQVWSALFGFLSIWLLSRDSSRSYVLSIAAFAVALFAKETAVPFLLILLGFIAFKKQHVRDVVLRGAPYVAVAILYLFVRSFFTDMQPTLGPGRYQFSIGLNIIENVARLSFAALVPASSVSAFVAFESANWLTFGAIAGATAVVLALVAWGVERMERRGVIALLGAASLLMFFPVAALNRVSELHVYNAMPFISMIVGAGLGSIGARGAANRAGRTLVPAVIALLFASNLYAVETKASLMKQNGARAARLIEELKSRAEHIPAGGELVLENPPDPRIEYSVFLMRGFNVLETPEEIKRRINRGDITVTIVDSALEERRLSHPLSR